MWDDDFEMRGGGGGGGIDTTLQTMTLIMYW